MVLDHITLRLVKLPIWTIYSEEERAADSPEERVREK